MAEHDEILWFVLECGRRPRAAMWTTAQVARYREANDFIEDLRPGFTFVSWLPTHNGKIIGLRFYSVYSDAAAQSVAGLPYNEGDSREAILNLLGGDYNYSEANHDDFGEFRAYRHADGVVLLTVEPCALSEDCADRLVRAMADAGLDFQD